MQKTATNKPAEIQPAGPPEYLQTNRLSNDPAKKMTLRTVQYLLLILSSCIARRFNLAIMRPRRFKRSALSNVADDIYWTIREEEYATDILFTDQEALTVVYPGLIDHAIKLFHREDVLRFPAQQFTQCWLFVYESST